MDRWARSWSEIVTELRETRLMLGLTQAQVAKAIGVTRDQVGRFERRETKRISIDLVVRHAAALGLKASLKFYPVAGAIRDEAQAKYIARFVERIGHAWRILLDAPIPLAGDLRAVDVLLENGGVRIAVEVITRLRDLQAQIRYAQQKQRDIGASRLIIVVAGSHANRVALDAARPTVLATFELDTRRVLGALERGADPGRDAVIVLR
ncbi:MAG TPA: helix-turn-helix transcriptional regulator [Candidatus Limnocylindrales bacterium]|nr:helix-turn-helix transcriptional regulator [Candidatus Limnocylindrales bacterium]